MQLASTNPLTTNTVYMETIMLTRASGALDSAHVKADLKAVDEAGQVKVVWSQEFNLASGDMVTMHPHHQYPSFDIQYILAITSVEDEPLIFAYECDAYSLFIPFPGQGEPNLVISTEEVSAVAKEAGQKLEVDTDAGMSGSYSGGGKAWVIRCSSTSDVTFTIDEGIVGIVGSNTTVYVSNDSANQTIFTVGCIDGEDVAFGGVAPSVTLSWSGKAPPQSLGRGSIAGIVVGASIGAVLFIAACVYLYKKKTAEKNSEELMHLQTQTAS